MSMKSLLRMFAAALAAMWLALAAYPASARTQDASSEPVAGALHFRKESTTAGAGQLMAPYQILAGLALAGGAAYWFRRRSLSGGGRLGAQDGVTVVDKCRLSVKTTLYVIHHRDREIVLVEHEHGVTAIRDDLKP